MSKKVNVHRDIPPVAGRGVGGILEEGQLSLDVGLDGEIYTDAPVLEDEIDDLIEETIPHTSVGGGDRVDPPYRLDPFESSLASPPGRKQWIAAAVALVVTLLIAAKAIWIGIGMESEVAELNQEVRTLQQRLAQLPGENAAVRTEHLAEDLNRLAQRVDELGVIVEGPVGHLRESNERVFEVLRQRLDRLEAEQKRFAESPAGNSPKPSADKVSAIAARPTPGAPISGPGKRGWVINLLSLSNAKTADEELARLRKMGIRADKQTVSQEGKNWYRLRVTGFDSYEGAKAYIDTVEKQTGIGSAWVGEE